MTKASPLLTPFFLGQHRCPGGWAASVSQHPVFRLYFLCISRERALAGALLVRVSLNWQPPSVFARAVNQLSYKMKAYTFLKGHFGGESQCNTCPALQTRRCTIHSHCHQEIMSENSQRCQPLVTAGYSGQCIERKMIY